VTKVDVTAKHSLKYAERKALSPVCQGDLRGKQDRVESVQFLTFPGDLNIMAATERSILALA
jgi:hypothetical protein